MPIVVTITPSGVQAIRFEGGRDVLHDPALPLWPVVRDELRRLDKRVRTEAARQLERVLRAEPPAPLRNGNGEGAR